MSLMTYFRSRNQRSRLQPPRARLQVERLEDRAVPSANIDITQGDGIGAETSIDLNPVHPNNLVAVAIHGDITSMPPTDQAYYSRDGGATWNASGPLPTTLGGQSFPESLDPTVAFDSQGNAYVSYLPTNGGPLQSIAVAKSTDGGQTFSQASLLAIGSLTPVLVLPDHPKMAIDTNPESPFRDTVYVTWDTGTIIDGRTARVDLMLSRSTDGGQTWSTPRSIFTSPNYIMNTQSVGPDGTLHVGLTIPLNASGGATLSSLRSTDGGTTFAPPVTVATVQTTNFPILGTLLPMLPTAAVQDRGGEVAAQQVLDTDRSAGPHRGRVYLAFADRPDAVNRPLDTDIYLQFSDDHGQTWSSRQRVNDDGVGNGQFFPSLSVDRANGEVVLSWYDTRRDPINFQKTDVFLAVGTPTEDGMHFGPNRRITKAQSDESAANPNALGFYGDYEGIVAYGGVAHPVWSDARVGNPLVGGIFREAMYTANVEYGLRDSENESAFLMESGDDLFAGHKSHQRHFWACGWWLDATDGLPGG
jgi:hypothetical protein